MGLFDKVEKSVGSSVGSVFSRLGKKDLKPADFVVALKEELESRAVEVGHGRIVGPNQFKITLSTGDFDKIEGWGPQDFANELVGTIKDFGEQEDYAFIGEINVIFEENVDGEEGVLDIESEAKGEESGSPDSNPYNNSVGGLETNTAVFSNLPQVDPTDSQSALSQTNPSIELDGKRYVLTKPVTVIGRGSDCDIILEDPSISRHHLEIKITPNGTIASDLGSANGMYVEGHQVPAATLLGGNTITIGKTKIVFLEPISGANSNLDG